MYIKKPKIEKKETKEIIEKFSELLITNNNMSYLETKNSCLFENCDFWCLHFFCISNWIFSKRIFFTFFKN